MNGGYSADHEVTMFQKQSSLIFLILGMSLNSCFQMPVESAGRVAVLDSSARLVPTTQVSEEKSSATMDPNAKSPQQLTAPSSGRLSGSSITLQPGSLSVAADLVVEEASSLSETSLVSELGLTDSVEVKNVGVGLIIRPSESVNLSQPLTINMPIPVSSGLRLQSTRNLTVFYKQFVGEKLVSGIIPSDKITTNADGTCSFEGYFGAYWVAIVAAPVLEAKSIPTVEPIVNAQKVSVIESTGVVSEASIVAKAEVPQVAWNPSEMTFDEATRSVTIKAKTTNAQTLTACKADLLPSLTANSGITLDTGSQTFATIKITKTDAHSLIGRFRCIDEQGRQTISTWTPVVSIPAIKIPLPLVAWSSVTMTFDASSRSINLVGVTTEVRKLSACKARFQRTLAATESKLVEAVTLSINVPVDSNEESTGLGRFECTDEEGRSTVSPWSAVLTIPAAPASAQNSTSNQVSMTWASILLQIDTSTRNLTLIGNTMAGVTLSQCQAIIAQDVAAATPLATFNTGTSLQTTFPAPMSTAATLYGRFSCTDSLNQVTLSPWSSGVNVPQAGTINTPPSLPDFCNGTSIFELHTTNNASAPMFYTSFQQTAACHYHTQIFSSGNLSIGLTGPDKSYRCGRANHTLLADGSAEALSCSASTASTYFNDFMIMPRGNYNVDLDFASGSASPLITFTLIPCALGNMHMIAAKGYSNYNFDPPDGSNVMQHHGACEFSAVTSSLSYEYLNLSFQNAAGTTICGSSQLFSEGYVQNGTCGSTLSYFSSIAYLAGVYDIEVRYGLSFDPSGSDTTTFSMKNTKQVNCPDDYYLLGPTAAAWSAMSTNKFTRVPNTACQYEYQWVADAGSGSSGYGFKIGNAADSFRCGVSYNYSSNSTTNDSRYLYCNAAQDVISSLIEQGRSYRFALTVDSTSGQPSNIDIQDLSPHCNYSLYLQTNSATGYFNAPEKMMSEGQECLFETVWTPTTNQPFHLIAQDMNYTCGAIDSSSQPSVGGSQVNAACVGGFANAQPNAILPSGISLNSSYKVQLDLRTSGQAKLSVVPYNPSADCQEDYYLVGGDFGGTPTGSNMFQKMSGCHYQIIYTPAMAGSDAMHVTDVGQTFSCGMNYSLSPMGSGDALKRLDCTGTYSSVQLNTYSNSAHRIDLYTDGGIKKLSVVQLAPTCTGQMTLGGPAGNVIAQNADRILKQTQNCVYEMLWTPSAGNIPFHFIGPDASLNSCGKIPGSADPGLGTNAVASCNVRDETNAINFSPAVTPGTTYRIRLDRSSGINPPTVSVNAINGYFATPDLRWMRGSSAINSFGSSGTKGVADGSNDPGNRSGAATWKDSSGNLWMFGGLVTANGALMNDLWSYDMNTNLWTWVSGTISYNSPGDYTNLNADSTVEFPSGRRNAVTWYDVGSQKLWLFGGDGLDSTGAPGKLNDLWSYNIANGHWNWEKGSNAAGSAGSYYSQGTPNPSATPGARAGAVGWIGQGKFWLFGGNGVGSSGTGNLDDVWSFDLTTKYWTWVAGSSAYDVSASASEPGGRSYMTGWPMADGSIWVFGGTSGNGFKDDMWMFDTSIAAWTLKRNDVGSNGHWGFLGVLDNSSNPSRRHGAGGWVDTSGRLWLIGGYGSDAYGNPGPLADIWVYNATFDQWAWVGGTNTSGDLGSYSNQGTVQSTNLIGARYDTCVWPTATGAFIFGGYGSGGSYMGYGGLNDLWRIDLN